MNRRDAQLKISKKIALRQREVARMWKEGKTQAQMGELLGYGQATISRDMADWFEILREEGRADIELVRGTAADYLRGLLNVYFPLAIREDKPNYKAAGVVMKVVKLLTDAYGLNRTVESGDSGKAGLDLIRALAADAKKLIEEGKGEVLNVKTAE